MQSLTLAVSNRAGRRWASWRGLLSGLFLTFTIAVVAFELRNLSGITMLSPLIIAIVVGLAIIAVTLSSTFVFTVWLGRRLGIDRKLAELLGAGTSICGASAVVATNTVTRASDEDVTYAVASVTVFGSVSVLFYPTLAGLLQLTPHAFGLWTGASIHEIAQVVAAAFQNGADSGNFGTIAKLSRVMLLAPMILALSYYTANRPQTIDDDEVKRPTRRAVPMPWFVLGFIVMMLVNSLDLIPHGEKIYLVQATVFLLTVALAAMGLETDFRKLRAKGWKPLLVGAGSWLFISAFSLALIELTNV